MADVISGLVLGRSVLNIAKKDVRGRRASLLLRLALPNGNTFARRFCTADNLVN